VVNEHGKDETVMGFSTAGALDDQVVRMLFEVNSTIFTLIRNSSRGALPLIATLFIEPVIIGLNGTIVNCMEVGGSMSTASTAIQIINTSNGE
jgi:hypothetical protein